MRDSWEPEGPSQPLYSPGQPSASRSGHWSLLSFVPAVMPTSVSRPAASPLRPCGTVPRAVPGHCLSPPIPSWFWPRALLRSSRMAFPHRDLPALPHTAPLVPQLILMTALLSFQGGSSGTSGQGVTVAHSLLFSVNGALTPPGHPWAVPQVGEWNHTQACAQPPKLVSPQRSLETPAPVETWRGAALGLL